MSYCRFAKFRRLIDLKFECTTFAVEIQAIYARVLGVVSLVSLFLQLLNFEKEGRMVPVLAWRDSLKSGLIHICYIAHCTVILSIFVTPRPRDE